MSSRLEVLTMKTKNDENNNVTFNGGACINLKRQLSEDII
jgi:hypothetical protein